MVRSPASDFEGADLTVIVGALTNVNLVVLEVDIDPTQAAQFGGAQSGEDRRQQQRAIAPGRRVELADDSAHFGG